MGASSGGFLGLKAVFLMALIVLPAVVQCNQIKTLFQCSQSAVLKTKYFVPFYEVQRQVLGCASKERTFEGWHVHVVRINTTSKVVHMSVLGEKNLLKTERSGLAFFKTFRQRNGFQGVGVVARLSDADPLAVQVLRESVDAGQTR